MVDIYRDFVFTRIIAEVVSTATTLVVDDVSTLPSAADLAPADYFLTFESALNYPATFEIVKLVAVDVPSLTLTVIRAQQGTAAQAHLAGTYLKGSLTSAMLRRIRAGFSGTSIPTNNSAIYVVGDRFTLLPDRSQYIFSGTAWSALPAGDMKYLGPYASAGTTFKVGDVVTEGGQLLRCHSAYTVAYGISFVGNTAVAYGSGAGSILVALPAGSAAGDLVIISSGGNSAVTVGPASYATPLASALASSNVMTLLVESYVLTAADINVGTLAMATSSHARSSGLIVSVYRGVQNIDTVNVTQNAALVPSATGVVHHVVAAAGSNQWSDPVLTQAELSGVVCVGSGVWSGSSVAVGYDSCTTGVFTTARTWAGQAPDVGVLIPLVAGASIDTSQWDVVVPLRGDMSYVGDYTGYIAPHVVGAVGAGSGPSQSLALPVGSAVGDWALIESETTALPVYGTALVNLYFSNVPPQFSISYYVLTAADIAAGHLTVPGTTYFGPTLTVFHGVTSVDTSHISVVYGTNLSPVVTPSGSGFLFLFAGAYSVTMTDPSVQKVVSGTGSRMVTTCVEVYTSGPTVARSWVWDPSWPGGNGVIPLLAPASVLKFSEGDVITVNGQLLVCSSSYSSIEPPGSDMSRWSVLGASVSQRQTVTYTTAQLVSSVREYGLVSLSKAWRLYAIQTDRACRVRLYDTVSHRNNDTRPIGTDPVTGDGVLFEFVAMAAGLTTLSPFVDGANLELVPSVNVPIAVTNTSGTTASVSVTLTFLATE